MEDRILDPNLESIDNEDNLSLRPLYLNEYIGQEAVKESLDVYIKAALKRKESLDHTLFYGPPGLGKTTLAQIIANELNVNLKTISGPSIEKTGDLAAILSQLEEGDVLFIDEIHRLPRFVEEVLYSAMEDYTLDILIGKDESTRSIKIDLPPFTLVGATTRYGDLSSPLRDRFGVVLHLNYYTTSELLEIVLRTAKVYNTNISKEAALELAKRSRGTPRIANRLFRRIRDFAEVLNKGDIDLEITTLALKKLGIDDIGYCYAIGCNSKQKNIIKNLIASGANDLKSSFVPDYSFIASYYSITDDDEKLMFMLSKSLYTYDNDESVSKKKQEVLFEQINDKKEVLKKLNFMKADNTLTYKGELLKHLNGYIQLPVIEFLSNDTLLDLSPVQLAGFAAALANMEKVTQTEDDEREGSSLNVEDDMLKSELKLLKSYLLEYARTTGDVVEIDTDTVQNIYRFAQLNSKPCSNSVQNWAYMYNLDTKSNIEYEGQFFRQITTTIDLLRQIYDIVDKEFTSIEGLEKQSYDLRVKILKAIELLNQDPVQV